MGIATLAWLSTLCLITAGGSSLSGHVYDAAHAPVAGARVFLEPGVADALRETQSGPDGAFAFSELEAGTAGVFAIAGASAFGGASVNLAVGETRAGIEIVLHPAAQVRGRVTDVEGKPISGASLAPVLLLAEEKVGIPFDKLRAYGFEPCITDVDGKFTMSSLPQGASVMLKVRHPLYAQEGLTDIQVGATDVRVRMESGVDIQGTVVSRDGSVAVANATVIIRNTQPPHDSVTVSTDHEGGFEVRLKPGIYLYQAAGAELRSPGWSKLTITGRESTERAQFRVTGLARVTGKVCDAVTGAPVANAELLLSAFGNPADLVRTGPEGTFALDAAEGDNVVTLRAVPGYLPPERPALRIQVAAGQSVEIPTFWVKALPRFRVRILDAHGNPAAGVIVSVLQPAQIGWHITDSDGNVSLQVASLPPDRRLVAMAEHPSEPQGALFALTPEQAEGATAQLLPLASVTGKAVTAKGQPLEGAVVGFIPASSAPAGQPGGADFAFWRTLAHKGGAFAWEALVPRVPLRCVVVSGAGGAGAEGASAPFTHADGQAKDIGNIVVTDGKRGSSLWGTTLKWHENPPVAGDAPDAKACSGKAALVLYCHASEAPMYYEALGQAARLFPEGQLLFALVVAGNVDPSALSPDTAGRVIVLTGGAPGVATTYVLDRDGKVMLETFGLPPLRAIQRACAGADAR